MTRSDSWLIHALVYRERFGFSVIPMSDDKRPMVAWKEFQELRPSVDIIASWPRKNLGIVTGGISNIVVVDCESRDDAKWFWENRGKTGAVVETRRGIHLYFQHPGERVRNTVRVEGRYDVRGDGGYVLAPPSRFSGGEYRWLKGPELSCHLPKFQMAWRPETNGSDYQSDRAIQNGVAYISRIRAVSGKMGHNDTYRAAQVLRESGLSEAEALVALQSWNKTNADPPWSDQELLHKIRDVYR